MRAPPGFSFLILHERRSSVHITESVSRSSLLVLVFGAISRPLFLILRLDFLQTGRIRFVHQRLHGCVDILHESCFQRSEILGEYGTKRRAFALIGGVILASSRTPPLSLLSENPPPARDDRHEGIRGLIIH